MIFMSNLLVVRNNLYLLYIFLDYICLIYIYEIKWLKKYLFSLVCWLKFEDILSFKIFKIFCISFS